MVALTKKAPAVMSVRSQIRRLLAKPFVMLMLVLIGAGGFASQANATFVSFTSLGDINPPFDITSLVPPDFIAGVYTFSLGGPGSDIPSQNAPTIGPILQTQLGLASVSVVGGGACNVAASNCSGYGTTSGSTTNVGNLFGVHIGGSGGGSYIAFLYDHPVSNFSLSWNQANGVNTLSNIHTFTAVTPIPAAAWLFGSGLAVLGFAGRRKKKPSAA